MPTNNDSDEFACDAVVPVGDERRAETRRERPRDLSGNMG